MRAILATSLILVDIPASAQQHGLPEGLGAPTLPGFFVGNRASDDSKFIQEEIPEGESIRSWTRMVTTLRFRDLALKATPYRMVETIAASTAKSCAGALVTAPSSFEVAGRAAAQIRVDCPNNPASGTPETFLMLAIAGQRDMLVKQVAFRIPPTPRNIAWAAKFLDSVTVCTSPDPASCKR